MAMRRINSRSILSLICALLIAAGDLSFARSHIEAATKKRSTLRHQRSSTKHRAKRKKNLPLNSSKRPVSLPREMSEQEDTEARSDWFLSQRLYPSNTLPEDARRRAWESVSRMRTESQVTPAASRAWRAIGPSPTISAFRGWGVTSGRINAIALSPAHAQIVLIGSATGGIWRSTDSGASFVPVTDDQVDLAVGSIAFSKSNPSIVYAGMGDAKVGYLGSGVLKSTDEGRTWSRVSNNSLPAPGTISKIEVDPADSNRLYVAQYLRLADAKTTSSGVYVSADGGVNWQKTLTGGARDVVIDAANPRTIYAGLVRVEKEADATPGIYRSTDRGATWTNIYALSYDAGRRPDVKMAVTPANAQVIYCYAGGFIGSRFEARFVVSTNGGATWMDRGTSGFDTAQLGYNSYVVADPRDMNTVYLGSRDLYRTTDGGATWQNLTGNFFNYGDGFYSYVPENGKSHPDQHAFAFVPGSSLQFYIGNDGGISKTFDGGRTFQSLNSTLTLSMFIGIAIHPTDASLTIGGTQDNGTQRRFAQSTNWREVAPGDGGRAVINPLDPSVVFFTGIRGEVARYYDYGQSYDRHVAFGETFGEPQDNPRIAFYPPFTGNEVDSTLYIGTWRLFTSTDLGNTWSAPGGDMDLTKGVNERGRDVVTAIGISRSDARVIYTGSAQGRAMRTTDSGATWTDVTRGLPDRFITSVVVHPTNPQVAYIGVSGFNTTHIFKTTDMGATWTAASSGLPDIPVNALLIDPNSADTIYAGTDVGVFQSVDGGASWRDFSKGLPPVIVMGFAAQSNGLIQAATYGRGVYEIVAAERPVISSITFDGKKRMTIEGSGFDEDSRVLINGEDRTDFLRSVSDTSLRVVGKSKKLSLKEGDNSVQVINSNGASNVFTLKI